MQLTNFITLASLAVANAAVIATSSTKATSTSSSVKATSTPNTRAISSPSIKVATSTLATSIRPSSSSAALAASKPTGSFCLKVANSGLPISNYIVTDQDSSQGYFLSLRDPATLQTNQKTLFSVLSDGSLINSGNYQNYHIKDDSSSQTPIKIAYADDQLTSNVKAKRATINERATGDILLGGCTVTNGNLSCSTHTSKAVHSFWTWNVSKDNSTPLLYLSQTAPEVTSTVLLSLKVVPAAQC